MMNSPEDIQELKDKIANGEPDWIENKNEVYQAANGIRIKITDQEGADLVTGRSGAGEAPIKSPTIPVEDPRADFIHDATHGSDRATWRDDSMKFTNSENPGARLHVTQDQIESARKEMEEALEKQPIAGDTNTAVANQETVDSNTRANEGFTPLTPMSDNGRNFFANQDSIAQHAKADAAHQEALDSNARANEGFTPLTPISENGRNFFTNQDSIAQQAKADAAHQEALDSNARANQGFTGNFSQQGQQSLENIDQISKDLTGKSFENSLSELMDEETAKRYMNFLEGGKEVPPVIKPQETEITQKLGEIDKRLETMDTRLNDISTNIQTLLQGQEAGKLTQEQLLEYVKLLQEQNKVQIEITQTTAEKYRVSMENTLNLIMSKIQESKQVEVNVNQNQTQSQSQGVTQGFQQQNQQQGGQSQQQNQQQNSQSQNQQQNQQLGDQGQSQQQNQQQGGQSQQQNQQQDSQSQNQQQNQQLGDQGQSQQQNQQQGGQSQFQQQNQQQGGQSQFQQQNQQQGNGPIPTVPPFVVPNTTTASAETIRGLQDQISELRGENTWEQRSADYARDIANLESIRSTRALTIAEKVQYFDLLKQKEYIDQNIIAPVEKENEKKRIRKEKIIKIVAGVAGAGIALATPAVGVAAVIGVTLGGRLIGKGLAKWGESLRSKSNAMKYEDRRGKSIQELNEMDKKRERKEWWGKRLGEASAVLIGGATGYGLGKAVQNLFGWGQGTTTQPTSTVENHSSSTPQTNGLHSETTTTQGPDLSAQNIPQTEVPTSNSVLVKNGRIDLPGSAWNGNLANGPAQDILPGGELNYSNYNGGISEMASNTLEHDLVSAGVTRSKLFEVLDTSDIHRLITQYAQGIGGGNPNPDLTQILNTVKPGSAEILLGGN